MVPYFSRCKMCKTKNKMYVSAEKNTLSTVREYMDGKSNVTAQVLLSSSIKMLSRIVKYIFFRHNPILFHSSCFWCLQQKIKRHYLLNVMKIRSSLQPTLKNMIFSYKNCNNVLINRFKMTYLLRILSEAVDIL